MPARIVVVDADAGARAGLQKVLVGQGYLVDEAASTDETLRLVKDDGADLVLLELDLGAPDGFALTKHLHATSHAGVIVVTHRADELSKVRALELGADDYLTKPYGERELLLRVVAVLRRTRTRARADAASYGGMRLDSLRNEVTLTDRVVHLSPKELLLLQALMSARGRLLSRKNLFATVWGTAARSDLKTLDVHIRRLRRKLEADPHEPEIIVTVRGRGYRVAGGEG